MNKFNLRLADAANRMKETSALHPKRWKNLGRGMLESINRGQAPRILAVGPRIVGGLKRLYSKKPGHGGIPGTVFEVTTMNDGTFDKVGKGSVLYALNKLGVDVVDIWGNGKGTQEKTFESLKSFVSRPLEMREHSVSGEEVLNLEEADSVVLACSDSRIQVHDIYDDAVVVSNAGNILSPAAIEVIGEMVSKKVPVLMVMGHTKCGAVGAAKEETPDSELASIVSIVAHNMGRSDGKGAPEMQNAAFSAGILKGDEFAEYYGSGLQELQGRVRDAKTEVLASFLNFSDGTVKGL
ncbi:MAG: carbonic anhydrase [Candidatus Micrarchaeia archaeon]